MPLRGKNKAEIAIRCDQDVPVNIGQDGIALHSWQIE
jgi:hypothetical protein